jgi:UDP-N-acetylmuramoylalanine--D-glutamate ligase
LSFAPKKALVIGMGESGRGAAALLSSQGVDVYAFDEDSQKLQSYKRLLDVDALQTQEIDQVIVSPGVALNHKMVQKALELKIPVISELELGLRYVKGAVIGITGTNGKTSMALFLTHLFKKEKKEVICAGNVGTSLCHQLLQKPHSSKTLFVLEMSSFQLETTNCTSLDLAIITSFAKDHLDRHGTMEHYANIKARILSMLKLSGALLISKQAKQAMLEASSSLKPVFDKTHQLELPDQEPARKGLPGTFFQLAKAVCVRFGIDAAGFEEAIKTFKKPPHRLEKIAVKRGITFYNDSKATNEEALFFALSYFKKPVLLILGGQSKGLDLEAVQRAVEKSKSKVIVYGQAGPSLYSALKKSVEVIEAPVFKDAVEKSLEIGRKGDIVLLSPACASFDQFSNFGARGEYFNKMIETVGDLDE